MNKVSVTSFVSNSFLNKGLIQCTSLTITCIEKMSKLRIWSYDKVLFDQNKTIRCIILCLGSLISRVNRTHITNILFTTNRRGIRFWLTIEGGGRYVFTGVGGN